MTASPIGLPIGRIADALAPHVDPNQPFVAQGGWLLGFCARLDQFAAFTGLPSVPVLLPANLGGIVKCDLLGATPIGIGPASRTVLANKAWMQGVVSLLEKVLVRCFAFFLVPRLRFRKGDHAGRVLLIMSVPVPVQTAQVVHDLHLLAQLVGREKFVGVITRKPLGLGKKVEIRLVDGLALRITKFVKLLQRIRGEENSLRLVGIKVVGVRNRVAKETGLRMGGVCQNGGGQHG